MIVIDYANEDDIESLEALDKHISTKTLRDKVSRNEILVLRVDYTVIGWLRYGFFWDAIPFMNMLGVKEEYRGNGHGKGLVYHWEKLMKEKGFREVLTSTMSNELSQHFYRCLGYKDIGSVKFEEEGFELFLKKAL